MSQYPSRIDPVHPGWVQAMVVMSSLLSSRGPSLWSSSARRGRPDGPPRARRAVRHGARPRARGGPPGLPRLALDDHRDGPRDDKRDDMTTIACTQPGCTGSILDGYCDICGSPAGPAQPSSGTPSSGTGSSRTTPLAGHPSEVDVSAATQPAGVGSSVSTMSRASNRLSSTALGSARTLSGSKVTRRLGTSSKRLRGTGLGAGLTTIPPIPAVDASEAIMKNPSVPEEKRNC